MKTQLKYLTIVLFLAGLALSSCNREFYPVIISGDKAVGYANSKHNTQKLSSVADNSFAMITVGEKRIYGGRTLSMDIELSGYKKDEGFTFIPQKNMSATAVLNSGKELDCTIHSAKESIVFPANNTSTLGMGHVYITSPRKLTKVDYLKINFDIVGESHTLVITPQTSLKSDFVSTVQLPEFGNKPIRPSYQQQTEPVKIELTKEQEQIIKSIESANIVTQEIKTSIQADFDETMAQMRKDKAIAENIDTRVKADMQENINSEGKIEYNLRVKYEYEVHKDLGSEKKISLNNVGDDFGSGKYKLSSSKAARVTLSMLKNTISNELKPYLIPGRKVTVKITGSADGSPIRGSIAYGNEFGAIKEAPCFINGTIDYLDINTSKGITSNEDLAFLRTLAVKDFIENNIEDLRVTDNLYQHFAIVSEEKGADQRKISMEIIIHEAFEDKYPELSTEKQIPVTERISEVDTGIVKTAMHNPDAVAIIIGNRDYTIEKPVTFAINDALTMKQYLIKTLGYKEEMIKVYENATSADFRNIFGTADDPQGDLANMVRKNISDVFIYYSGHGVPDWDSKEPYLLPVDVEGGDARNLRRNAYKLELLYDNLNKLQAKSITVVLDACYSGSQIERSTSGQLSIKPKEPVVKESEKMIIYTAAKEGEEASWYKVKNHGMFTYCFLMGLKHNTSPRFNSDNQLTYKELFDFLSDDNYGVPYYSRGNGNTEHHPTITGANQENVFITY